MNDSLNKFGFKFQIKLIISLITDKIFLEQIFDILHEDFFDSDANKWLIKLIKNYYDKYKEKINFDVIKVELSNIDSDILKVAILENLKEISKNFNSTDLQYVKEKALEFCKNQALKTAILESINLLESGDYDRIKQLIDEASIAGIERHLGHEYLKNFDERYDDTIRKCVKTGWDVIDDLTAGGLGSGEIGTIVGTSGGGKSWFLSSIGANALKLKKKVVHYTLELSAQYTGLRYDSVLSGYSFQELKYHKDEVKEIIKDYNNSLVIKQYPATIATVNTIRAHLSKLKTLKFNPDLIIVDYADLLASNTINKSDNSYSVGGRIYEELRGLASESEIPVWTVSQANRSAIDEEVLEADKISESYKKVMTADFVMSISRKTEDKIAGTGRIHIIKNRFGSDGMTYNAKINASNGNIKIFDKGTINSYLEEDKQNKSNEYVKKLLAEKYNKLNSNYKE